MNLDQLEHRFGVTLPRGYRTWVERGYCEPTKSNASYLWVNDAEWLALADIPTRNMWRDHLLPGLIPFAFTGGGDNWCWNTNQPTESDEFEILMCYRDDDLADAYAPTFPAWFYRTCLDYASCVENLPEEIGEARAYLRLWSDRLREIGPTHWADHLKRLFATDPAPSVRRVKDHEYPEFGFLSHEEADAIVARELGSSYLGRTVEYGHSG